MEMKVHDIVRFHTIEHLVHFTEIPAWIAHAKSAQNYAVVRRIPITEKVPIGLRGNSRKERHACFINREAILEIIRPTDLVAKISSGRAEHYMSTLNDVKRIIAKHRLLWGPTGSIGFELATGIKVTNPYSDYDIAIYIEEIDIAVLKKLFISLNSLETKLDVQIELKNVGSFILLDFIKNYSSGFLIRTIHGPQLWKVQNETISFVSS